MESHYDVLQSKLQYVQGSKVPGIFPVLFALEIDGTDDVCEDDG